MKPDLTAIHPVPRGAKIPKQTPEELWQDVIAAQQEVAYANEKLRKAISKYDALITQT